MISQLPLPIARYLRTVPLDERVYAFVGLDETDAVKFFGGKLAHFGLEAVAKNERILEKYSFLEGLFTGEKGPVVIHNAQFKKNLFVDVHLFNDAEGQWVLFVDNTDAAISIQSEQQKRLNVDLRNEIRKR